MEPEKVADKEAANEGAEDTDNEVRQQPMIAAGDPLGDPASQDANNDARDDIQGWLLRLRT